MGGLNKDKTKSLPITKQMIWDGYMSVKRNAGGAGVDQMTIEGLEENLGDELYKLWNRMSSGSYFPPEVKRVLIPKGGKGYRPLGIPTVLDRIAQYVVKAYIEPRLEEIFHENSYGYRVGRSAHQALGQARINCRQYDWVIDLDIKGFFDCIDHELLMKAVERHAPEKWVQMYVRRWLNAGVLHEDGRHEKSEKGTPQGGVISPILANLYLHYGFDVWMRRKERTVQFERYADDIIVHCKTEQEAERLLERIKERFKECGLELNPEKTRIVYCKDSNRKGKTERPKKFTFLGYDFKPRKKWNTKEKREFTGFDLGISGKAKIKIRSVLKLLLTKLTTQTRLEDIAILVNAKLRGWIGYYAKFNRWDTRVLWTWFNYRLMNWIRKRYKRFRGSGRLAFRWLRKKYRFTPQLFVHWQLSTP
ncbi:MAG TPA: group II intron reverse transcriptase/maturase [Saprospiraceae bacterium]|nr:group II intron reverse transcriptase/maturase [Saprospiraceae bacterium]